MHNINLEEDAVECLQNMVIIKFSNCPKQIPCNLIPVILQTKVCVADITEKCRRHYLLGKHICYHEAVKWSFSFIYVLLEYYIISCWSSMKQYQSDFFFCYNDSLIINFITSQVNVVRKKTLSVVRRLFCLFQNWFSYWDCHFLSFTLT